MKKSQIHLVKASFLAQFITAMKQCGASPGHYLKKVKLPLQITDPESLLPIAPFYQLINMFALEKQVPNFGSIVAQITPWHMVDSLGPLISRSRNLRSLLQRFCEIANGQSSSVNFSFIENKTESRFCYNNSLNYYGDVQMEFYRLTSMVQLVQLATGASWRPRTIHLLMPEASLISTCPLLNSSELVFLQAISSISIETEKLDLPVSMEIPGEASPTAGVHALRHIEYTKSVRQIIESYSLTPGFRIEDLAQINGHSVRSVQRRLKLAGLNFNQLNNEARYRHASAKLCNSDLSVAQVANLMGYADPAHFSRAFRRWSGISPAEFRKRKSAAG